MSSNRQILGKTLSAEEKIARAQRKLNYLTKLTEYLSGGIANIVEVIKKRDHNVFHEETRDRLFDEARFESLIVEQYSSFLSTFFIKDYLKKTRQEDLELSSGIFDSSATWPSRSRYGERIWLEAAMTQAKLDAMQADTYSIHEEEIEKKAFDDEFKKIAKEVNEELSSYINQHGFLVAARQKNYSCQPGLTNHIETIKARYEEELIKLKEGPKLETESGDSYENELMGEESKLETESAVENKRFYIPLTVVKNENKIPLTENENKKVLKRYQQQLQEIEPGIRANLSQNKIHQQGITLVFPSRFKKNGVEEFSPVFEQIKKIAEQKGEFNHSIQFHQNDANKYSYISCDIKNIALLTRLMNQHLKRESHTATLFNYKKKAPITVPALDFSEGYYSRVKIDQNGNVDFERMAEKEKKAKMSLYEYSENKDKDLEVFNKYTRANKDMQKFEAGCKDVTWGTIYKKLCDGLASLKKSDEERITAEMQTIDGLPKASDAVKIRKLSEYLVKEYRKVLRSYDGLPHLFGYKSPLEKTLWTFCDKKLGLELPRSLEKGQSLSLDDPYNITIKPLYHAMVYGADSIKIDLVKVAELFDTIKSIVEHPDWVNQTFLSNHLPLGIKEMRGVFAALSPKDTIKTVFEKLQDICIDRLETHPHRTHMTNKFYQIIAHMNIEDQCSMDQALLSLQVLKGHLDQHEKAYTHDIRP